MNVLRLRTCNFVLTAICRCNPVLVQMSDALLYDPRTSAPALYQVIKSQLPSWRGFSNSARIILLLCRLGGETAAHITNPTRAETNLIIVTQLSQTNSHTVLSHNWNKDWLLLWLYSQIKASDIQLKTCLFKLIMAVFYIYTTKITTIIYSKKKKPFPK